MSWTANSRAKGYRVYYRKKGTSSWSVDTIQDAPTSGTIKHYIGREEGKDPLSPYTNYEFYVRAYVFEANDDYCGTKTATLTRRTSK